MSLKKLWIFQVSSDKMCRMEKNNMKLYDKSAFVLHEK